MRAGPLVLAAALALAAPSVARAQRPDPQAPTVTPSEAALLAEVESLRAERPEAALALLESRRRPDSSPALDLALGNLLAEADRLDEAEAAFRTAIRRHPDFRAALGNLARLHLLRDQPGPAAEAFRRLLALDPADPDTLHLLGQALLGLDQPVSAETAFRQALLHGGPEAEVRAGLVQALIGQERLDEAAALLREMTARSPHRALPWRLRAGVSLNRGEPDRALVEIETARRLGLADTDMLRWQGDLYLGRGQPGEAAVAYERAFAIGEGPPDALLRAARAWAEAGDLTRASGLLERIPAEEIDPAARRSRLLLRAELARLAEDPVEARKALEELVAEDPGQGRAMLELGRLAADAGQTEEALLWFERAGRIAGYEAASRVEQARIEAARRRFGTAADRVEEALAFDPTPALERYRDQLRRLAEIEE